MKSLLIGKPAVALLVLLVGMSLFAGKLFGKALKPVPTKVPTATVLQEMHDLRAERTRLGIKRRYHRSQLRREPANREKWQASLVKVDKRLAEIEERLRTIHERELRGYERVAVDAVLECSEEPLYGQPSYGIILYATASRDIRAEELLLFHAGGVYRNEGIFPRLTTKGVGWYFRPNKAIRNGTKFVVACIQDAPEEIENVKRGYMPNSSRARDPNRAYRTNIFIRR